MRIVPPQYFPRHYLSPTIIFLYKIRKVLQRIIHNHEREKNRKTHPYSQECHLPLDATIGHNWCCIFHSSSCINDYILIGNYIYKNKYKHPYRLSIPSHYV